MQADERTFRVGRGLELTVAALDCPGVLSNAIIHIQPRPGPRQPRCCAVVVQVTPSRLRAMLGHTAERILTLPSLQGCIDVSVDNPVVVRQVVDEIDDNTYEPGYFDLFLEGKVITLLAEGLSNRALATGECPYARAALDILTATPLAAPTVAELARRVGLSPRKLAARFQAQYGQTIVEWVADLRIGCARDLVTQSALPIKEISAAVGYAHVPAFSAAFARRFGVSPTRMRAGKTLE